MLQNTPTDPTAETCWEHFWQSGRVQDYLDYRAAVEKAAEKEPLYADSNRRTGAAGSPTG